MAKTKSEGRKTGSIQSLERGLAVLMAVADARRDIGLADLVERTSLDRSCVFRLAQTLVDQGFLSQSAHTKQYRLGGGIWQLAGLLQQGNSLLATARPYLVKLREQTGETSHLSIRQRDSAISLEHHMSEHIVGVSGAVGRSEQLYCSAVGKALISEFDLMRLTDLLGSNFPTRTNRTIGSAALLYRELQEVRAKGYAIDDEEHTEGVRCVASPVRDHRNEIVASVGVSAPSMRLPRQRLSAIGALVRQIAEQLSAELGYVANAQAAG
jgi:IclR family KDG regulon transcriptional repressor